MPTHTDPFVVSLRKTDTSRAMPSAAPALVRSAVRHQGTPRRRDGATTPGRTATPLNTRPQFRRPTGQRLFGETPRRTASRAAQQVAGDDSGDDDEADPVDAYAYKPPARIAALEAVVAGELAALERVLECDLEVEWRLIGSAESWGERHRKQKADASTGCDIADFADESLVQQAKHVRDDSARVLAELRAGRGFGHTDGNVDHATIAERVSEQQQRPVAQGPSPTISRDAPSREIAESTRPATLSTHRTSGGQPGDAAAVRSNAKAHLYEPRYDSPPRERLMGSQLNRLQRELAELEADAALLQRDFEAPKANLSPSERERFQIRLTGEMKALADRRRLLEKAAAVLGSASAPQSD